MKKVLNIFFIAIVLCGGFIGITYACDNNQIDIGNGNCVDTKFTITTTNLENDTTFAFYMSAQGTFYVDWGDGTVDTIVRNDTINTNYSHTYATGGVKTIRFGGLATGYSIGNYLYRDYTAIRFGGQCTDSTVTRELIASINGSLGAIFPTLGLNSGQQPSFRSVFECVKTINSLPENLFSSITGTGVPYMFTSAFDNCSGLQSIPAGLFSGITNGADHMFQHCFYACHGLTGIPPRLFANITTGADYMFYTTFWSCDYITGFVPNDLFSSGLTGTDLMTDIFYHNTSLATSCPTGYHQYITGYEDYWNGHVSCEPNTINITWEDATPESVAANNAGSCTYGGTINTPAVAPTKRGYVFTGWTFDTSNN